MEVNQVWKEIRSLKGRTLKTLDRRKPFIVVAITDEIVTILPQSTGKQRPIGREGIEMVSGILS